ncbi:peroxidase [candidate division TA06 bacterium DG_24]|uniref:Peroxidase n=3 Tax=Bacteria division TA06 TaxID=1156500 RepID=A0A0S8JPL4_UNCT6|nr:MAG: peroxidase [candidate division TA06 bacterium DG_24]KPK71350.1 MAG: peroxidase [candidate division TA06 bacterium SM23_40]KPL10619.1 MAG: peroxidase [candidate division TA06 bacterium SM1_40]
MPWISTIDDREATGQLKELYERLKRERGKISNIMRVHSLNPSALHAHIDLYLTLMFGTSGLSREERELIAVIVSAANRCEYCVRHHAEALRHYWHDDEKLRKLINDPRSVNLPDRSRLLVDYALTLSLSPEKIDSSDIQALRSSGFSDEDILNINLITSYFCFVNRVALGLGVELTPEEVRGYRF